MRLLVLGGTLFLGRHVVDAALAHGDAVTIFTRGQRAHAWGEAVVHLVGNRDPDKEPGLAALDEGTWDAVIDTSGYLPRCVRASAQRLRDRAAVYVFVSSVSVYADASLPGITEDAPVVRLADPSTEAVMEHYGALKAACEQVVHDAFGEASAIVRPGLIVGPYDPTDRFAYWVARFRLPWLLGERNDRAVVPAPPTRPVQLIDARDLAGWLLDLAHDRVSGVFNACTPRGRWMMGDLVDALCAERCAVRPAWVADATLLAHEVAPWTGLPLWIPAGDGKHAGLLEVSAERAHAAGLRTRTLADTVAATAAWLATRDSTGTFAQVLTAAAERAILQDVLSRPDPRVAVA